MTTTLSVVFSLYAQVAHPIPFLISLSQNSKGQFGPICLAPSDLQAKFDGHYDAIYEELTTPHFLPSWSPNQHQQPVPNLQPKPATPVGTDARFYPSPVDTTMSLCRRRHRRHRSNINPCRTGSRHLRPRPLPPGRRLVLSIP